MKNLILLAIILSACGQSRDHPERTSAAGDLPLAATLSKLKAASDQATGWPDTANCDGTLWAGLAKAAGSDAQLDLAEYDPGQIHRRPISTGTCFDGQDVGSRSTISRDMLIGYMWARWAAKDLAALQRLADYGADHDWQMGQPASQNEVHLGDNLKGILCRAIFQLSNGEDSRDCREKWSAYLPVLEDYEKHIQALTILLDGETFPGMSLDISDLALQRLNAMADDHPTDGLFQAARGIYTGDYDRAVELLKDPAYTCPSYVRGADTYCLVHRAFAMWLVLKHTPEGT